MFYQLLKPIIKKSRHRSLARGESIYHEGDLPESLFLIDSGLVGLFHISPEGKETFLRIFNKDSIFGHRSYFAGTPYHATAITLAPTQLTIISEAQCQEICKDHPDLLKEMTKLLAQDLGAAELRLAGLQDKTAPRRIIESLLFLKLKYPEQVWTRKEIAEFSGTTLETVARWMSKLADEELLIKEKRDYVIPDIEKMLSYAKSQV